MYSDIIGIVGGMGSIATLHCFNRFLNLFPAEKEWDRPRIIIDNRCDIPSRVRALLYGENYDIVVRELGTSIKHLVSSGATKIILCCNTSHAFLPNIFALYPEIETYILNMIEITRKELNKINVNRVFVLGTEGTFDAKLYSHAFEPYGITALIPQKNEWPIIRQSIEDVKQSQINDQTVERLLMLIEGRDCDRILLGCTELSVLFERISKRIKKPNYIIDPLEILLQKLANIIQ